jgi:prephenate dehydrogenase
LALRGKGLGLTILGHDQARQRMRTAHEMDAVESNEPNLRKAARKADILILNVALAQQAEVLQIISGELQEQTVVIDLAGIKGPGMNHANDYFSQGHYVGAQPILSARTLHDGRRDIEAATADLFEKSVLCIVPSARADPKAVETVVNLGRILGATPFFLDAGEYDTLVQGIETIPGLLSAAIFRAITRSQGWRDMLRFAGLTFSQTTAGLNNEDLAHLAFSDPEATLRWLDAVMNELQNLRRWIDEGDQERLSLILRDMGEERDRWIREREKNEWSEVDGMPDTGALSVRGQLFGFRGPSGGEKA